jgi:hypothetical protein
MTNENYKTVSEITKADWVVYNWVEATEHQDKERVFMRTTERTPEEAHKALNEWRIFLKYKKLEGEK